MSREQEFEAIANLYGCPLPLKWVPAWSDTDARKDKKEGEEEEVVVVVESKFNPVRLVYLPSEPLSPNRLPREHRW